MTARSDGSRKGQADLDQKVPIPSGCYVKNFTALDASERNGGKNVTTL